MGERPDRYAEFEELTDLMADSQNLELLNAGSIYNPDFDKKEIKEQ